MEGVLLLNLLGVLRPEKFSLTDPAGFFVPPLARSLSLSGLAHALSIRTRTLVD